MRRDVRARRLPAPLVAGLVALALGAAGVESQAAAGAGATLLEPQPEVVTLQAARRGQLTLDQAIEMAERRFRARVVRAAVEESAGQRIYVLRLLSEQGRVWTVRVDAQSGAIQ